MVFEFLYFIFDGDIFISSLFKKDLFIFLLIASK
ncbi:hypothetical protein N173_19665 [Acinetobacter baumannii EGD-HP18]|uniref:Uncharacterized protein n=1 Tax=Acinetobacter baumannii EGD-HP18 TaxID=1358412 RepID=A0AAV3JW95_ACIBA|nr:hypothetical protein N173_19665 [Acinetobacter baumannii EGD-HP18]